MVSKNCQHSFLSFHLTCHRVVNKSTSVTGTTVWNTCCLYAVAGKQETLPCPQGNPAQDGRVDIYLSWKIKNVMYVVPHEEHSIPEWVLKGAASLHASDGKKEASQSRYDLIWALKYRKNSEKQAEEVSWGQWGLRQDCAGVEGSWLAVIWEEQRILVGREWKDVLEPTDERAQLLFTTPCLLSWGGRRILSVRRELLDGIDWEVISVLERTWMR